MGKTIVKERKSNLLPAHILAGFSQSDDQQTGMLYAEADSGQTVALHPCTNYRLFFLLDGHISLHGRQYGTHTVTAKEFILLPPLDDIDCDVFEMSKYIIVHCDGLHTPGNSDYFNRLKRTADKYTLTYAPLPIHEKLATVLQSAMIYNTNELQYSQVFDTVFVFLRVLYSQEELASFFISMLIKV